MKQAVILIHGIGEQVPMDTLRGFVETVWTRDGTLRHNPSVPAVPWSKPDKASGDFELRRLTTAENCENRRTDFFEFYWAHMMEGTEVGHLLAWAKVLLLRSPARVPQQLRGLWYFLVIVTVLVLTGLIVFWLYGDSVPAWIKTAVSGVGTALWLLIGAFVVKKVAGDAARYLHVAPPNIESRRRIRDAGVRLLETLHTGGSYDRIIVVGHSLGTVIGYDVLTHYWARRYEDFGDKKEGQATQKLERIEALARKTVTGTDFASIYQVAQSEYLDELRTDGHHWLVTDFVTMGSPMAHAILLLARNAEEFAEKKMQREFPTCPPTQEEITVAPHQKESKFTFRRGNMWIPHHAAVFAPTRWTNLYFPCRFTLWGDLIGGPVAPAFGPGILDLPVETCLQKGLFTHTLYWEFPKSLPDNPAPGWIARLRQAVRICQTAPQQQGLRQTQVSPAASPERPAGKQSSGEIV